MHKNSRPFQAASRNLSAVINATSSTSPIDEVSGISSACVSKEELYRKYRTMERGDPCGRPMARYFGSDSKSPTAMVLDLLERYATIRVTRVG